jgi:hypothetical protein
MRRVDSILLQYLRQGIEGGMEMPAARVGLQITASHSIFMFKRLIDWDRRSIA